MLGNALGNAAVAAIRDYKSEPSLQDKLNKSFKKISDKVSAQTDAHAGSLIRKNAADVAANVEANGIKNLKPIDAAIAAENDMVLAENQAKQNANVEKANVRSAQLAQKATALTSKHQLTQNRVNTSLNKFSVRNKYDGIEWASNTPVDELLLTESGVTYAVESLNEHQLTQDKEIGFWDAIPHNDPVNSTETEFALSYGFTPPLIGRFTGRIEGGFALSMGIDNLGGVAFGYTPFDISKGVGGPENIFGISLSKLDGPGLTAADIVYGDMVTGGPNVKLAELNKLKKFKIFKDTPSLDLNFDYEIGSAFTPDGPKAVRGFEFGLDVAQGGSRIGSDITYQHTPNRNLVYNWGVLGQVSWAFDSMITTGFNDLLYKGMDTVTERYANPEQPKNNGQ